MTARRLIIAAALLLPAAGAVAQSDVLFPAETAACYLGTEVAPAADAPPARKGAVAVSTIRLERGYPQLAFEQTREQPKDGGRVINLRIIVSFADAGKKGAPKRFADGLYGLLRCAGEACDGGNYKVERQADGTVLLRMTGGLIVGSGEATRTLADGQVYRLAAKGMEACW